MIIQCCKNNLTGRVSVLNLTPTGAADELFLNDLLFALSNGIEIDISGPDGTIRTFVPGSKDEEEDSQ